MKTRQKRLVFILAALAALSMVVGLVLYAIRENVNLYFTPTQVANNEAPIGSSFRIGGMVKEGSVQRGADGLKVHFEITDSHKSIPVMYEGILPDLFKEGEGVVAQGRVQADGVMYAEEVLAKHDENYMPPEAADAMAKAEIHKAEAAATEAAAQQSKTEVETVVAPVPADVPSAEPNTAQ